MSCVRYQRQNTKVNIYLFQRLLIFPANFLLNHLFLLLEFWLKLDVSFLLLPFGASGSFLGKIVLLLLLPTTVSLSVGFWRADKSMWGEGKEGRDGEGDGGGEWIPGRGVLVGRGRSLKDLKLSVGELGRLSSASWGSFLTTKPGSRHLDKNLQNVIAMHWIRMNHHWMQ